MESEAKSWLDINPRIVKNKKRNKGKTMAGKKEEANIKAYSQNFTTMTPGPFAKWIRTCVVWQAIRFIVINIKMLVVVSKSH